MSENVPRSKKVFDKEKLIPTQSEDEEEDEKEKLKILSDGEDEDEDEYPDEEGAIASYGRTELRRPTMSLPVFPIGETSSLVHSIGTDNQGYGSIPASGSWSTTEGSHPYTRENRPKRRPFHLPPSRRISGEQDSELYARFRYYSRLRAPAGSTEYALVIPDHVVPVDLFLPFIPGHFKDLDGKQSSHITVIAIWNTMMGTSLLTMPWAFGQAGFAGGFIIMIGMASLCFYTAYRILTLQKIMGLEGEMHEVGYLCRSLWPGSLGKVAEGLAVTFSVVTLVGAQVVYWVLMSNFLFNTGQAIYEATSGTLIANNTSDYIEVVCPPNITQVTLSTMSPPVVVDVFHRFWRQDLSVPLILVIPFLFLLNIRNTAIFTFFNSFGAISVIAIYLFVIIKAVHWGLNFTLTNATDPLFIPLFKSNFMALSGTLSLAYFIHNCIITIMKGNRHPENNVRDLSLAYLLVSLTYIPVGAIFYLAFPIAKFCLVSNFLDNFPPHNLVLAIVRGFLLFQMLTVFPLLTCFVRAQLLVFLLGPGPRHTFFQITSINVILLTLCVLVSIFYPNIGFILRWVGAIAGLAYIFVIPCLSYMQALHTKQTLTWKQIIPHSVIIVLGFSNFAAQFFLS